MFRPILKSELYQQAWLVVLLNFPFFFSGGDGGGGGGGGGEEVKN